MLLTFWQRDGALTTAAFVGVLCLAAGCSWSYRAGTPEAPRRHLDGASRTGAVTYTVEFFDFDNEAAMSMAVTQTQLGGALCPCVKVPYPAGGLHNDAGSTAIANTPLRAGDTVLGFSLGSQVMSLYLAQNRPPPGVRFVLLGETFARNDQLVAKRQGIPADIANPVTLVVREYDGWSDSPTNKASPHFGLAMHNAEGVQRPFTITANVVTSRGNIRAVLI